MRWMYASGHALDALRQRHAFVALLRERGYPEDDYDAAELVFGELVSNVVRHADGSIAIALDWSRDAPVLSVTDAGRGFAFAGAPGQLPSAENGRGLFLVATLADHFKVERFREGGCCVSATLRIRRRAF